MLPASDLALPGLNFGSVTLLVLSFLLLAGSFLVIFATSVAKAKAAKGKFYTAIFGLFALGSAALFGSISLSEAQRDETVSTWVEQRYGLQIPEDQISSLAYEEIVTLEDGTKVRLELPENDSEGYLLYNLADRSELATR
jgi:hypothetical protein